MPADELADAVGRRRRSGEHRLVVQVPLQIGGKVRGRSVAARPILLQRLHRDPVEIAFQLVRELRRLDVGRRPGGIRRRARRHARARPRRIDFTDHPAQLVEQLRAQRLRLERHRAGQEFVEDRAKRVDVGARVDVEPAHFRLFRAHVFRRADECAQLCVQRPFRQRLRRRLRDAEVDDLRHRVIALDRDQHVGRFQVAMDDPLLVRVLDAVADLQEEADAVANRDLVLRAVGRDRLAADELHHEVRPSLGRRTSVEHARDGRMVHQRQRLALRLEPCHHLRGVHPRLDDLERDLSPHRPDLFREPDDAHAAFAEGLDQSVGPMFCADRGVLSCARVSSDAGPGPSLGSDISLPFCECKQW
jgi:hypothetical protein